jgi:hypothetical protein
MDPAIMNDSSEKTQKKVQKAQKLFCSSKWEKKLSKCLHRSAAAT